jgi:hypothetical protein
MNIERRGGRSWGIVDIEYGACESDEKREVVDR